MLMRELRFGWAVAAALAGCLLTLPAAAQPQTQIIVNFEDGSAQGFEPRAGQEVLEVSAQSAKSGRYALQVTGRKQDWNGPSLRIDTIVEEGAEYIVTAWVHALGPDSSNFRLSTQIGEGASASYANLAAATASFNTGWVELRGSYRYSNTSSGYITLYIENDTADAEYLIDDITVQKKEGSDVRADLALPSLKQLYQDAFLIGTAFSPQDLHGVRFDLLRHHFNAATAENMMKPVTLQSAPGVYAFDGADQAVQTLLDAGLALHGHTLAWHQQSPVWLNTDARGKPISRQEAERNLVQYARDVAVHFAGKVTSWDVLNEAMMDNPPNPSSWQDSLRKSGWFLAFANGAKAPQGGADYVAAVFLAAREADPSAVLYYNDYNLDDQDKAQAVAAMVKQVNEEYLAQGHDRLLIEGVGMQGHYHLGTKAEDVEASLRRFIDLGVRVSITELDVTVGSAAKQGLTPQQELQQAAQYARLFQIYKQYAQHIDRVTFWGMDDGTSWRAPQFPLLFRADLSAKPAFFAVADPEGFLAGYDDTPQAPAVRRGRAAYGTPQLGSDDALWQQAEPFAIDQMLQAWDTASGEARVLWDKHYLYVRVQAGDDVPHSSGAQAQDRDSVEVFLDEANGKTSAFNADDARYLVDIENRADAYPEGGGEGFASAVSVQDHGYTVELKLPFRRVAPRAGRIIGFDIQINDAQSGARTGAAIWNDISGNAGQDPSRWGEIELIAPADEQAQTADPVIAGPAKRQAQPALGSAALWGLAAGGAIAAVACAILVRKRKRK